METSMENMNTDGRMQRKVGCLELENYGKNWLDWPPFLTDQGGEAPYFIAAKQPIHKLDNAVRAWNKREEVHKLYTPLISHLRNDLSQLCPRESQKKNIIGAFITVFTIFILDVSTISQKIILKMIW